MAEGQRIGYARVSTREQNDDSQIDDLKAAGCDKIFVDHGVSGKLASRPELNRALEYLRPGDSLVITRLSRAMRSLHDLLDVVNGTKGSDGQRHDGFAQRGIALVVLRQGIDTSTPAGRLLFHVLASIDEFQRDLIVEGTYEGLAAARARGRNGGRKEKLNAQQKAMANEMFDATGDDGKRKYKVQDIADMFGTSRQTIYRVLSSDDKAS
jgi:DNA invertase Pin-like site-specific DNA recombinase